MFLNLIKTELEIPTPSIWTEMELKKKSHTFPIHTREQVAKISGVGIGTVARYDAVMKSGDEDLNGFI